MQSTIQLKIAPKYQVYQVNHQSSILSHIHENVNLLLPMINQKISI